MVDVSPDNIGYETESNRSSVLFERSQTQRNKDQNGQKYLIDFEDGLYGISSSPTSHKQIYLQQQPRSMPVINETNFSPIIHNSGEKIQNNQQQQQHFNTNQSYEEINLDYNDIQFSTQQYQEIKHQEQSMAEIQLDLRKDDKMKDQEIQVDETLLSVKDMQAEETKQQNSNTETKVVENVVIQQPEQKMQQLVQEIDTFYDDIARQLALEIEREEAEAAAEEQRQKELREQAEKEAQQKLLLQQQNSRNNNTPVEIVQEGQVITSQFTINNSLFTKSTNNFNSENELKRDSLAQAANPDSLKLRRFQTMGSTQDKYARLQQMNTEKLQLLEQLNQAKQQLENLSKNLPLTLDTNYMQDVQLHLAFLFASPLVIRQNGQKGQNSKDNFNTVPLLEFTKEFKEIKQSIKETKKNVKIRAKQATIENLTMILTQNPLALHFSGHGIENNRENFGRQFKARQGDGNYLLFETEDGEGELVSEKMLQEFIQSSNTNLEFVFVASCYSEFAGKIFLNAGAKHVICVRSGEQIADLAVITFSKSFYNSVFSSNMTICDSFKLAQKQVQGKYGLQEAQKFSILIRTDGSPTTATSTKTNHLAALFGTQNSTSSQNESSHRCKNFGLLKQGELEFLEPHPRFKEFPSKVDKFIGRQKEMFEVVHNIYNHRLVTVIGLPGIGKTALCKNAVHYIAERKIFKEGIVFLPLKGYMSFELFLKKLVLNFVASNFELQPEEKKNLETNIDEFTEMTFQYLKTLEEKLLIIFDNVEDLLQADKPSFRKLVNDLLDKVPNLHILMTSRTTLGALQDVSEKILILQELSAFYTVDLFISRSREIPQEEIKELLDYQPESLILVGDSSSKKDQKVKNLGDHHFFKILGGNPHAIILAAPILIRMKLKELYQILNSKEMHEVLQVDGIKDSTVASLRLSLEASIQCLQKEDEKSYEFFFLIGMLPGGIEEEELEQIWGEDYQKHVDKLINFSLISKKELPNEKPKLILPPFMIQYSEAKITQELRLQYQNDICYYYAQICKKILDQNGKSYKKTKRQSELNHQVMEKLLKHETNIWACIYRMVDAPIATIQEELATQESLKEYINKKMRRVSTIIETMESNKLVKSPTFVEIKDMEKTKPHKNKSMKEGKRPKKKNSEYIEQKPFEIMVSQTPRTDQKKGFIFPENDQKPSQSVVPKGKDLNDILESENEEEDTDSLSEDSCESDDSLNHAEENVHDANEMNNDVKININASPEKSKLQPASTGKQDKLDHIMRNSNVNFQRTSQLQGSAKLLLMIKSSGLQRRLTVGKAEIQSASMLKLQQLNSKKTKTKIEELHAAEKLIIYYVMNLYLLRENDNALNMINDLALKAHGGTLYEANIMRILGLIQHNRVEIEKSLEAFEKAKQLYTDLDCKHGMALSYFSISYIYRSKIAEFITKTDEDVILQKSKQGFQTSLKLFQELNHIVGQALCHQQLAMITTKLGQRKESTDHSKNSMKYLKLYTIYTNKSNCPHVQRVHGSEISLMAEIVHDNDNRDLFPPGSGIKTKKKSMDVSSKNTLKIDQLQHHNSTALPIDFIEPLKLQQYNSLYTVDDITPSDLRQDTQVEEFELFDPSQTLKQLSPGTILLNQNEALPKPIKQPSFIESSLPQLQMQKQKTVHKSPIKLDVVYEVDEELKVNNQRSSTVMRVNTEPDKKTNSKSIILRKKSYDKETNKKPNLLLEDKDKEKVQTLLNRSAQKTTSKKIGPIKQIKTTLIRK